MNNRRKSLARIADEVSAIGNEIEMLAAEEQTNVPVDGQKERDQRVKGWQSRLEDLHSELSDVLAEEEEYLELMPENLRAGERGQTAGSAIQAIQEALDGIEELYTLEEKSEFNSLWYQNSDGITSSLDNAQN